MLWSVFHNSWFKVSIKLDKFDDDVLEYNEMYNV